MQRAGNVYRCCGAAHRRESLDCHLANSRVRRPEITSAHKAHRLQGRDAENRYLKGLVPGQVPDGYTPIAEMSEEHKSDGSSRGLLHIPTKPTMGSSPPSGGGRAPSATDHVRNLPEALAKGDGVVLRDADGTE